MHQTGNSMKNNTNSNKITVISRNAQLVTLAGLVLLFSVLIYLTYLLVANGAQLDIDIAEEFLEPGKTLALNFGQRLIGIVLISLDMIVGIVGLYKASQLFSGFQKGQIFTTEAASQIRTIGWAVVALVPASMIHDTVGAIYFYQILNPGKINLNVSFTDGDIYALVFGLLFVVIGHVMLTAVTISEENQSFV